MVERKLRALQVGRLVSAGNAVYHGLAGQLLLQGGLSVLRLRVIAPMEYRISMVLERMKMSRQEAIAHIEKVFAARFPRRLAASSCEVYR